jgi:DNA repair exonuclease SbcCD ATPase subunit
MTVGEPLDTEGGWAFSDEDPLLSPVETTSSSNALFSNSNFGNSGCANENANTTAAAATAATVSVGNDEQVAQQQQQFQEQLQALQLQVEQLQTELTTAQAQCTQLQSELNSARSAAAAAEDEVTALSHVRRRLEATELELEKLKLSASGALSSRRLSELEAATPRNTTALVTGGSSGVSGAAFFGSSTVATAVNANAALEIAQLQEQLQTTKLEVNTPNCYSNILLYDAL